MKILIYAFISLLFVSSNVFAGLSVTPARSEIIIEPDSFYNGSYTIQNGYDSKVSVSIITKNWNNSADNKDVNIDDWLTVIDKTAELMPGEKKEIKYTVKSGNRKGSLSGMISFTLKSPEYSGINLMTSVPVYMTVDGTQNISFDIEKIELKKSVNNGINVVFAVKNSGNVHLRLNGDLKITKGKKKAAERKISNLSPVYPDMSRSFSESIGVPLSKGKYVLSISLNALGKTVEKNIQIRVNKYGDVSF